MLAITRQIRRENWCSLKKKPRSYFQYHPWVIIGYLFRFSSISSCFFSVDIFKRWHPLNVHCDIKTSIIINDFHILRCGCVSVYKSRRLLRENISFVLARFFSCSLVPLSKYLVANVIPFLPISFQHILCIMCIYISTSNISIRICSAQHRISLLCE